ncbi:hypothetical protein GCM10025762_03730 [Haloechinothrix salitolerans]
MNPLARLIHQDASGVTTSLGYSCAHGQGISDRGTRTTRTQEVGCNDECECHRTNGPGDLD